MENVVKIAFVGGPQSGKTSLIEYLRNYLKADYDVIIAEEAPTVCLRAGLNPPYNITGLDFQLECLKEYRRIYKRIDLFTDIVEHKKPVVILYDTIPEIGQTYLKNGNTNDYNIWKAFYDKYVRYPEFKTHRPDIVYNCELLQSSYSPAGNVVRRELETQKVLSVSEKISEILPEAILLSNKDSIEERASIVIDYIDRYFKPNTSQTFTFKDAKCTMHQSCVRCGWNDNIDINRLYRFCPMCGQSLNLNLGSPTYPFTPGSPTYPNITWTCQDQSGTITDESKKIL